MSGLPTAAPRGHHLVNNLAARQGTRLLYLGGHVSCALWGNGHLAVHWIDEDMETAPPRPDVYPYTLVVSDVPRAKGSRPLRHHADVLAPELVYLVNGWSASGVRRIAERDVQSLSAYDVAMRLEVFDDDFGVFVLESRRPEK